MLLKAIIVKLVEIADNLLFHTRSKMWTLNQACELLNYV
jgi:hypothetical protein